MHELERFKKWAKPGKDPDSCWEWTGYCSKFGHGQMSAWGRTEPAHRVAYRLFNGPIPTGLVVRHTCDNPPCTNPKHLILGTVKDNADDRETRGRGVNKKPRQGSENLKNLTEKDKKDIFISYLHNESPHRISRRYLLTVREVVDIIEFVGSS